MIYSDARPLIKSGDLLAWAHKEIHSWYDLKVMAVRVATMSAYSHVGIAWRIGGRLMVIEAVMPKIRIYPLSKLGDFYLISDYIGWTNDKEEEALKYVGENYSQIESILAFFKRTMNKGMQCAKFVSTIKGLSNPNKTPSQVVELALEEGKTLKLVTHKLN